MPQLMNLSLNRLQVMANETIVKGCMRWNTEKYQIGTYACDKPNCNKDLDQGDCAHVCDERKTSKRQPAVAKQLSELLSSFTPHHDVRRSPRVAVIEQVLIISKIYTLRDC